MSLTTDMVKLMQQLMIMNVQLIINWVRIYQKVHISTIIKPKAAVGSDFSSTITSTQSEMVHPPYWTLRVNSHNHAPVRIRRTRAGPQELITHVNKFSRKNASDTFEVLLDDFF